MTDLRDTLDADTYRACLSEEDFQHTIVLALEALGYRTYHTHDSRRSDPGYPDITAVGCGRLLHIEVKVGRNRPSQEQLAWLHDLADNGFESYLVYPKDWDDLLACLAGRPHGLTQGPRPDAVRQAREARARRGRRRGGRSARATLQRLPRTAVRFPVRVTDVAEWSRRLLPGPQSTRLAGVPGLPHAPPVRGRAADA